MQVHLRFPSISWKEKLRDTLKNVEKTKLTFVVLLAFFLNALGLHGWLPSNDFQKSCLGLQLPKRLSL